jgi:hypothetical protein
MGVVDDLVDSGFNVDDKILTSMGGGEPGDQSGN